MGQILAIVSSKGGVGKTTTAVNLAAAFASLDFPTLLVEADPQCGIVANFGFDRFDIPRGLAEVARRQARADEVTFETSVDGLHLVSSNVWSQAEEADYLRALEADPLVFREQLASVAAAYDYVVIDAPPMLGAITVAILAAADRFIVPLQTEPQALRSLGRLVETAGQVRDRHNPRLIFDGIALTMVDSRTRLSQQVIEQVQAEYPELAFSNSIPRSVRLSEMAAAGRPLVVAAPASRGARAYAALAEEILLKHARERMIERAGDDDDADGGEGDSAGEPGASFDPAAAPEAAGPDIDTTPHPASPESAGPDAVGATDAPGFDADENGTRENDAPGNDEPGNGSPVALDSGTELRLTGRVAIASGRIPERGGDIHKRRRRARALGHVTLLPPGVSGAPNGFARPDAPNGTVTAKGPVAAKGGVSPLVETPRVKTEAPAGTSAFLEDDQPDEWNEQNFVDLDTYMQMESGETAGAGALAADEDEWDEEWGQ